MQVALPTNILGIRSFIIVVFIPHIANRADEFFPQGGCKIFIHIYLLVDPADKLEDTFIFDTICFSGFYLLAYLMRVRGIIIIGEGLRHIYGKERCAV